jgi:hypothetical protein
MKYKLISKHPEDLTSGVMVGPGEVVDLSAEEARTPHNQRLIAAGKLVEIPAKGSKKSDNEEGGKNG